ncbi:MAG: hypothetical protein BWY82_01942 [Verrucomicrobia bacterium ADurb.Bin474]|nr:MAG: hypothetical protein BWY82_01942 [Verrucomicrobia bacterium ADurb.Bin474]
MLKWTIDLPWEYAGLLIHDEGTLEEMPREKLEDEADFSDPFRGEGFVEVHVNHEGVAIGNDPDVVLEFQVGVDDRVKALPIS